MTFNKPKFIERLSRWCDGPKQRLLEPDTRLIELDGFTPKKFMHGVELLNDAVTPMQFVVDALVAHAGLAQKTAVDIMCRVHLEGGVLLPLDSSELAERVALNITQAARENSHPLVCRAVSVQASKTP